MSSQMKEPEKGLARRLLQTVPYRDRLCAGRLVPNIGTVRNDVRSLNELCLLLTPDSRSLAGVNFKVMAEWMEGILGDKELAVTLREATAKAGCYAEGCFAAYEIVASRFRQAVNTAGQEG